eukprot:scaffold17118_cov40-Prasinocladus_malaysianus.AAC.3
MEGALRLLTMGTESMVWCRSDSMLNAKNRKERSSQAQPLPGEHTENGNGREVIRRATWQLDQCRQAQDSIVIVLERITITKE